MFTAILMQNNEVVLFLWLFPQFQSFFDLFLVLRCFRISTIRDSCFYGIQHMFLTFNSLWTGPCRLFKDIHVFKDIRICWSISSTLQRSSILKNISCLVDEWIEKNSLACCFPFGSSYKLYSFCRGFSFVVYRFKVIFLNRWTSSFSEVLAIVLFLQFLFSFLLSFIQNRKLRLFFSLQVSLTWIQSWIKFQFAHKHPFFSSINTNWKERLCCQRFWNFLF